MKTKIEKIKELMEIYEIPDNIQGPIIAAYTKEYYKVSDGGTLVPDFFLGKVFEYEGTKQNPIFVTHDYLYDSGVSKWVADWWLYEAMQAFGHTIWSKVFLGGLQTVGWPYYWGLKAWQRLKKR